MTHLAKFLDISGLCIVQLQPFCKPLDEKLFLRWSMVPVSRKFENEKSRRCQRHYPRSVSFSFSGSFSSSPAVDVSSSRLFSGDARFSLVSVGSGSSESWKSSAAALSRSSSCWKLLGTGLRGIDGERLKGKRWGNFPRVNKGRERDEPKVFWSCDRFRHTQLQLALDDAGSKKRPA